MTNPVARVVSTGRYGSDGPNWRTLYLWCPACDNLVALAIHGEDGNLPIGLPCWDWDENLDQPTLSPSILQHASANRPLCHSFLRAGRWEFLADCTHPMAGQMVDMVPLPDWVVEGT